MSSGEFERIIKLDRLPGGRIAVVADENERAALARRFGLPAIRQLQADIAFSQSADSIDARGRLTASFDQRCAVSDQPFPATLDEPVAIRFVPALAEHGEDEEIEFASDAPDEVEYHGAAFDLGEALAQSFGLALNPYALGPEADTARRTAGGLDDSAPGGAFAALAALKTAPEPD